MFESLDLTPGEEGTAWIRGRCLVVAAAGLIKHQFREAWKVAFATEPSRVDAKKWARWPQQLDEIRTLIRRGAIRFEDSQESS